MSQTEVVDIVSQLNAEYPELAELETLSEEAFLAKYPTADAQAALIKRATATVVEFPSQNTQFIDNLRKEPILRQKAILTYIRNHTVFIGWSEAIADKMIAKIIEVSGLNLSVADSHICPKCENKKCDGPLEVCSQEWTVPGCQDFNYPCDTTHSIIDRCTNKACRAYNTQYRLCEGHTCMPIQ